LKIDGLSIDVWIGNNAKHFDFYNFNDVGFNLAKPLSYNTKKEKLEAYNAVMPKVKEYKKKVLLAQKEAELEELKAELK